MKAIIVIFTAVFFCGCMRSPYIPPKPYQFPKSVTVSKDYETVWRKTINWLSENNTPIKTIDKASGFIATERNLSVSEIAVCDCGTPENSVSGGRFETINGNMNIMVEKISPNETRVRIDFFLKCFVRSPANPLLVEHAGESTGIIESEMFTALQQ